MNETRKPPTKEALKSRAVRILDKMMDWGYNDKL